jgi:hypothetical protein
MSKSDLGGVAPLLKGEVSVAELGKAKKIFFLTTMDLSNDRFKYISINDGAYLIEYLWT